MYNTDMKQFLKALGVILILGIIVLGFIFYDAFMWAEKSTIKGEVHRGVEFWYLENRPLNLMNASVEGLSTELQQEGLLVECAVVSREVNAGAFDYHVVVQDCRET